jgi:hypothetical protein
MPVGATLCADDAEDDVGQLGQRFEEQPTLQGASGDLDEGACWDEAEWSRHTWFSATARQSCSCPRLHSPHCHAPFAVPLACHWHHSRFPFPAAPTTQSSVVCPGKTYRVPCSPPAMAPSVCNSPDRRPLGGYIGVTVRPPRKSVMRKFKLVAALGAPVVVSAFACGGSGIKTTQKADGQVTLCSYGGRTYNPGESFRQDCNTCLCGGNGQVACTLILCITDASSYLAPDAASPDVQADVAALPDGAPDVWDAPQVEDAATNSSADAGSACTPPVVGAACTADEEVACAACCTDRWICQDGAWLRGFIGCLPGLFSCGNLRCQEGIEYCEISAGDNGPTQYACQTLPSGCWGARCPTCDCLTRAGISFPQCTAIATGDVWAAK